jgi:hypothetical protein
MSYDVCRELICHLDKDGSLGIEASSKAVVKWLEAAELPWNLDMMIRHYWPQQESQIGHISWLTASELVQREQQPLFMAAKLLEVGSAPNGDPFVIDFSSDACAVGFVSHEEFSDNEAEVRKVFQPIARSFASFLHRVAEERYLPTDYFAAKAFNEFLREEQNAGKDNDPNTGSQTGN